MTIFDILRNKVAESRVTEELMYQAVVQEISAGIRRDGLWAKAYSDCNGNEAEAKARYIKYRVQSMLDEARLSNHEEMKVNNQPTKLDIPKKMLAEAFEMIKQGKSYRAVQIYKQIQLEFPQSPEAKIAKNNLKHTHW